MIMEGSTSSEIEENNLEIETRPVKELVQEYINYGMPKNEAIKKVAKLKGLNKNIVYMECVENNE